MKKLYNPTNEKVSISYKGNQYEIEADSLSELLDDEVVDFWLKIHSFLVVNELTEAKVEEITKPSEIIEENIEVELPKKGRAKKVVE